MPCSNSIIKYKYNNIIYPHFTLAILTWCPSAMLSAPKNECLDIKSAWDVTGMPWLPSNPSPVGKDGGKLGGAAGWGRKDMMEEKGGSWPGGGG